MIQPQLRTRVANTLCRSIIGPASVSVGDLHAIASRRKPPSHHRATKPAYFSSSTVPSPANNDENVPAVPIDFSSSSQIKGEESHVAMITLEKGQVLRAESGAMLMMTEGVEMDTKLAGMSGAFSRMLTGQNVFLTDFRYEGEHGSSGTVALGTDFPSKILRLNLADHPEQTLICQRGAFLAANLTVQIETEMTHSLTAGFFGGQGFILQKLTGEGDVLIKAGGTLVKKELEAGEVLRVTSGSIVAFERSVQYNVQMMPGIKNAMFGGEGLFITTLTGPGTIWLQGMPPDRMISEVARRVPSGGGIGLGVPIMMGGGGGGADEAAAAGAGEAAAADAGVPAGAEESANVVTTDAAVEADRQATVASSGMSAPESDSPGALFGDAAPETVASSSTDEDVFSSQEDSSSNTSFSASQDDDTSFSSFDDSTSSDTFTDDFSSGSEEDGPADGELFSDTGSAGTEGADGGGDDGGGLLGMLWDIFTGGDE